MNQETVNKWALPSSACVTKVPFIRLQAELLMKGARLLRRKRAIKQHYVGSDGCFTAFGAFWCLLILPILQTSLKISVNGGYDYRLRLLILPTKPFLEMLLLRGSSSQGVQMTVIVHLPLPMPWRSVLQADTHTHAWTHTCMHACVHAQREKERKRERGKGGRTWIWKGKV